MRRTAAVQRSLAAVAGCLCLLACGAAAQTGTASHGALELTSLLGRRLYALPDNKAVIEARKALDADPKSVAKVLALEKAQAARKQYREAVATATAGLAFAPESGDLYLERGHRELGLREFLAARKDLEKAAKLSPTNNDVFYHLGLSHYFVGEFKEAAKGFGRSCELAKTTDNLIDCTNWQYVSLRRAGDEAGAAAALARITPAVKNDTPHGAIYLSLDHFYQGKITEAAELPPPPSGPDDTEGTITFSTVSYGVGNWRLYHGDKSGALKLFAPVVQYEAWNAWGFIGSEVELARAGQAK
jgi:tetratricopeptide (TPR) repeat protein